MNTSSGCEVESLSHKAKMIHWGDEWIQSENKFIKQRKAITIRLAGLQNEAKNQKKNKMEPEHKMKRCPGAAQQELPKKVNELSLRKRNICHSFPLHFPNIGSLDFLRSFTCLFPALCLFESLWVSLFLFSSALVQQARHIEFSLKTILGRDHIGYEAS